jgi:hypothetical protein
MGKISTIRLILIVGALAAASMGTITPLSAQSRSRAPQSCTSAKECKGPLAHDCRICPDGIGRCNHWTCANGKCATEICSPGN